MAAPRPAKPGAGAPDPVRKPPEAAKLLAASARAALYAEGDAAKAPAVPSAGGFLGLIGTLVIMPLAAVTVPDGVG